MRKGLIKGFQLALTLLLTITSLCQFPIQVYAAEEYENIALDKTVTVTDETIGNEGKNVVDGKEDTKWETNQIATKPTLIVDLGKEEIFEKINLKWSNNFAFRYKIYLAKSNQTYTEILFHEEGTGGDEIWDMPENTTAQYIKIELIEAKSGENSIGLKELEVLKIKENEIETPKNIALNKPAYASANEANLERLGPKGAFDGNLTDLTNGRWSSGNITKSPQWIYVDLEEEMEFTSIHILWQDAYATKYVLQYSNDLTDDKEWTTFVTVEDGQGGWENHDFDPITARFVRLYATASNGIGSAKPISIMEMEIYQEKNDSLTVEDVAKDFQIETITSEMKKMPVYSYDNDNIVAEIFCSDTDFVVEDNGTIHTPLVDKEVLVTYIIKDKRTNTTKEMRNIPVTIPGIYSVGLNDNEAPVTVPTIQEWKGSTGQFELTSDSRIVVLDSSLQKAAEITQADILDLFGLELSIVKESPRTGDIVLTKENADQTIGEQGYTLDIDDYVIVKATTYQGVFFGTRSVLQALQSSETLTIAKGQARDYAKYEHRKFMLDVARKYIPMWYLEDFVKYASWYKFTDIQIHLNDTSYNGHSRFRLESDIPHLTATDGYYTKDEYRDFQYYAQDYGITIISEFDTPAHSAVFIDNNPELGFDATHLDIRLDSDKKETVYQFIADLYEEYMGGDNPVFVTDYFNVGLDEFNSAYKEDMTQYTQYVMDLVYTKYGKTPLAWASMGCVDSSTTKIPDYPIMDAWANYAISLQSLFNQDYQLINATNKYGYIVPGGNNGYSDFAKEEEMYNNLSAGKFRDKNNAGIDVAEGHPKIAGGSISLWNDRGIYNGISVYDVFARTQSILPIYAQTFWYGKDNSLSYTEFKENVNRVGIGANITADKEIDSTGEQVYDFDMENVTQEKDQLIIHDNTENQYDAIAVNAQIQMTDEGQVLKFNGDGYLQMEHTALKWPYTIAFDLTIDENQSGDITLFEETMPEEKCNQWINTNYQTRRIYLKEIDGKYQLMYDRDNYHYEHNVILEKGKLYQLAFTSDEKYTNVYIDGILKSTINGPVLTNSGNKWYDSASIYLPLQKIGVNFVGTLDNIKVYNRQFSKDDIKQLYDTGIDVIHENIALNKEASASSYYIDYQKPEKAFDGVINQSDPGPQQSRWASQRTHNQWIQVDLKDTYKVDQIKITWEDAYGVDYQLLGSLDGEEWFNIKTVTNGTGGVDDFTELGNIETRYIKLVGTKAANNAKYGYSIYEIEVYESAKNDLLRTIDQINAKLEELNVGNYQGQIKEQAYQAYVDLLKNIVSEVENKDSISEEELIEYKETLSQEYSKLKKQIVRIDKSLLEDIIETANQKIDDGYTEQTSTTSSWNAFVEAKEAAEDILTKRDVTQDEVDSVISSLSETIEKLTLHVTKDTFDMLNNLVEEMEAIRNEYPSVIFEDMEKLIEDAKAVIQKGQKEVVESDVQQCIADIEKAKGLLNSYKELQITVQAAQDILNHDSSIRPSSIKMLELAYNYAEQLIKDNCKDIEKLDNAKKSLVLTMDNLLDIVERDDLSALLTQIDELDEEEYTSDSWQTLMNSYQNAQEVVNNLDADEEDIQEAYRSLLKSFNGLKHIVDKSDLNLQMTLAKEILENKDKYDEVFIKELESLINQADEIAKDDSYSQDEVNQIVADLIAKIEEAKDYLKVQPTPPTNPEPDEPDQPVVEPDDPKQPTEPSDPDITIQPNPSQPSIETPNSDTNTPSPAETGDTAMIGLFTMLCIAGLSGVACFKKKKER